MSQLHDELVARLARKDDLAETRRWYLNMMAQSELYWHDLTPVEQQFMNGLMESFEAWLRPQS